MMELQERDQNEFNMAISYLNRLNYFFYLADGASVDLDIYTRFHSLSVIFEELSTEMTDPEIQEFKDLFDSLAISVLSSVKKEISSGQRTFPEETYKKLRDASIKLRKIMKSAGLQNRKSDSASNALK